LSIDKIIKFKKICDILEIETKGTYDFERRLMIQKMFYFLQKLGLDLGIKYNFHTYGPYSADISDIYATLNQNHKSVDCLPDIEFSNEEIEIIKKLKEILLNWGKDLKELEFYSSVLYIYQDMYIKNQNRKRLIQAVRKFKPNLFNKFNIEKILDDLKKQGLLK